MSASRHLELVNRKKHDFETSEFGEDSIYEGMPGSIEQREKMNKLAMDLSEQQNKYMQELD